MKMAKKTSSPDEKPAVKRGTPIKKITVDYWKTKMHAEAMGIKKDVEYQAKSPQFTKEYELKGKVYFNDDKDGKETTSQIIAVNMNDLQQKSLERRLMVRTFTALEDGKGGRFLGGIELSMLESIQLSMCGEKTLSSLVVVRPDSVYLTRIFRKRKMVGDSFSFILPPDEKEEVFHFIDVDGKPGAGDDFNIKVGDQIIGEIDDKVLDIGGKYEITIKNEEYQYNKDLHQVLVLFCCALKYLKDVEGDLEKILKKLEKAKTIPEVNFKPFMQELDLFKNPRKFH